MIAQVNMGCESGKLVLHQCCIDAYNPCIFGLLRSFALNVMRFNKIESTNLALYDDALNLGRVLNDQRI